jgi:hypothetical protein
MPAPNFHVPFEIGARDESNFLGKQRRDTFIGT